MEYYENTIYDTQNEKDYSIYYNVVEHFLDFQIVFWKSDDVF